MNVNADLHIHSKYSMATSNKMNMQTIAREAAKKGIDVVGTGDCLHSRWMDSIKKLPESNGVFSLNDTSFVLTVEIEGANRVHHLLIIPSISKAEELRERFLKHSSDIDADGRPNVDLGGAEIAEYARDAGALIGPCHAFTPWTAMYAYHDSLEGCYLDLAGYVSFVELGLSADSSYADRISELHRLTFLTNSDAHSPWPNKLAREFNRFEMPDITFDNLKKAILRKNGCKPVLNVGMFPEEGKYNESACIRCFKRYTLQECLIKKWRCACGARIKKGVRDRVNELADLPAPEHPSHRPEYLHLIPLAEIIALALGHSSPYTKTVQSAWNKLIKKPGSEIAVLVDADVSGLEGDRMIVDAIRAFREGRVVIHPGGGGRYGSVELPDDDAGDVESDYYVSRTEEMPAQRSLFDYI
ncbi:MAG TPA: TIGR00375 family protein [Methanosarcinales archaeon]|nr:TIGR00375 family protein [Methanosarcinales archaeon]